MMTLKFKIEIYRHILSVLLVLFKIIQNKKL
jgi:hypothetical protein